MATRKLNKAQLEAPQRLQPVASFDIDGNYVGPGSLQGVGYRRLVLSGSTVTWVSDAPASVVLCEIRCEGGMVRYRGDGPNPTATDGMPLWPMDALEYRGPVSALRFIRVDGAPVIHVDMQGVIGT
ncbi:hypothetical protein [Frigidibacter sp. MR17.24]|uniref:hypothetical protein n=1 Tax=Frigidibacter sp. MR17.24 TaxID=3127345 RepID=UPI003012E6C6